MSGYRNSYRRGYGNRGRSFTPGRVERINARPGPCRTCHEQIPAGGGQLWRESDGSWSVVHVTESQGGWLMHPQPVRGGCPADTDKRNAELTALGFLGQDAPAPVSEREHIAATAATYAATHITSTPRQAGPYRGYRRSVSYGRCNHEDYPCCGCGE